MSDWIKNIFNKDHFRYSHSDTEDKRSDDQQDFIWCLVGNIVEQHTSGENREIKFGSKHFSPHKKVYCFPPKWGDGYENIKVIGRHRGSNRYVCIIMPSKLITNWRLQKVYRPYILKVMKSQFGWTNDERDKEDILKMLNWLPDITIKMDE